MSDDTADGREEGNSWPCCLVTGLMAGSVVAGDATGWARIVGFDVLGAGGWAAHGAGSTQHRSKAKVRIDDQAVGSFMKSPSPSPGRRSDHEL
jgi:hypothetical protein